MHGFARVFSGYQQKRRVISEIYGDIVAFLENIPAVLRDSVFSGIGAAFPQYACVDRDIHVVGLYHLLDLFSEHPVGKPYFHFSVYPFNNAFYRFNYTASRSRIYARYNPFEN